MPMYLPKKLSGWFHHCKLHGEEPPVISEKRQNNIIAQYIKHLQLRHAFEMGQDGEGKWKVKLPFVVCCFLITIFVSISDGWVKVHVFDGHPNVCPIIGQKGGVFFTPWVYFLPEVQVKCSYP